jgi:ribose-phosphate pyrophosphokinase
MILLNGEEIKFTTFPNGETNVDAESISVARTLNDNLISFKYENDGDLIRLKFLKRHLDTLGITGVELLIYYMPYSRMDRSENGSVFTLKYVAEEINDLNFHHVTIVEPHSDVTTALVDNSHAWMVNEDLIEHVMDEVDFDPDEDFLIYPDAGAQKRYEKFFNGNVLVGHKKRDFATGKIVDFKLVGDGKGARKAIIVDDLSSYGGTFLMTAAALKERGFKEIYLLVAHAEDAIFLGKLLDHDSPIDKLFTTDTILDMSEDWTKAVKRDKIKVYSIQRLFDGE